MEPATRNLIRIGIDIGGTFTDFVVYQPDSGTVSTFKLLSTPANPAEAVLSGLERIFRARSQGTQPQADIIHGSTVATNALLERRGAVTALITTRGFRDVLQIGRQNRPSLYDWFADPPPPLVPNNLRFEVSERIDSTGGILTPLDPTALDPILAALQSAQVESVAVCLLFSFLYPQHEQELAARLRTAGLFVSVSSDLLPEYREYERTSTTVVNAYVSPVLDRYLANLVLSSRDTLVTHSSEVEKFIPVGNFQVMQSNGGTMSLEEARCNGVRCVLSGPAGGVIGARTIAERALAAAQSNGEARVRAITFDMGGTSTDVSLIDGAPKLTAEAEIGGCPIRVPVLDIHTIGAGGGSIASVDLGWALRVGPESAGADPGPACYGKGEFPTVTDANLVLGRLAAEHFLGGRMPLDRDRALRVMSHLSEALAKQTSPMQAAGMDATQAALGVIEIVNAHMERALRVISVERGHDPKDFMLVSFGGAGGLHAADLARRLGIGSVLVPLLASTLSAFGMLAADVVKDYSQTVMLAGYTPAVVIAAALEPLVERGLKEISGEEMAPSEIVVERALDMRYRGQSYELTVPYGDNFGEDFHTTHRQTYGYARPGADLEIVNVRVRVSRKVSPPPMSMSPSGAPDPSAALIEHRWVVLPSGAQEIPFYRGESLLPGNILPGPAIVVRSDTTILIGPTDQALVDTSQNLLITIGA